MPVCITCQSTFPNYILHEGKLRELRHRKNCPNCTPLRKNYIIYDQIDWVELQKIHDSGLSLKNSAEKYGCSLHSVNAGIKKNFLIQRNYGKNPTKETRLKQAEHFRIYYENNPENRSWTTKISMPCEIFKDRLRELGFIYEQEYPIVEGRRFAADIAFLQYKIVIEINGNQHYDNNKNLKPYYQDRHDKFVNCGWMVYEIPYYLAYRKNFIDNFMKSIFPETNGSPPTFDHNELEKQLILRSPKKYYCIKCNIEISYKYSKCTDCRNQKKPPLEKPLTTCNDCGKIVHKTACRCMNCQQQSRRIVERPSLEELQAELCYNSFLAVGRKYGVSDNAIRKWIKSYEKDL